MKIAPAFIFLKHTLSILKIARHYLEKRHPNAGALLSVSGERIRPECWFRRLAESNFSLEPLMSCVSHACDLDVMDNATFPKPQKQRSKALNMNNRISSLFPDGKAIAAIAAGSDEERATHSRRKRIEPILKGSQLSSLQTVICLTPAVVVTALWAVLSASEKRQTSPYFGITSVIPAFNFTVPLSVL